MSARFTRAPNYLSRVTDPPRHQRWWRGRCRGGFAPRSREARHLRAGEQELDDDRTVDAGRLHQGGSIQRTDSAMLLNVHLHVLALDGVYARDVAGALVFHPLPTPDAEEVAQLARRSAERLGRAFEAQGRPSPWQTDRSGRDRPRAAESRAARSVRLLRGGRSGHLGQR
jgi:hypothetical protein